MKASFNAIREKACNDYTKLVNTLNHALLEGDDSEILTIRVIDIKNDLDNLRIAIGMIALCEAEGQPDFKCVLDNPELLPLFNQSPENESKHI